MTADRLVSSLGSGCYLASPASGQTEGRIDDVRFKRAKGKTLAFVTVRVEVTDSEARESNGVRSTAE